MTSGVKDSEARKNGRKGLIFLPWIICLIIALCIWVYVVGNSTESYEKSFSLIDIKVEGADELSGKTDMMIYDQSESKLSITVSGLRADVNELESTDFIAYVDVSGITGSGKHTLPVKISVPGSVAAVSYYPTEIVVYTDARTSAEVPVNAELVNYSVASNMHVGSVKASSETVVVTGPSSLVSRISAAKAVADLGSVWISSSFSHNAKLELVDRDGQSVDMTFLSVSHDSISIEVPVTETTAVQLAVEYASGIDMSRVKSAEVKPSYVNISGDPAIVEAMGKLTVITVQDMTRTAYNIKSSELKLPDGVELESNGEFDIKVTLEFVPEQTQPPETTSAPETEPSPVTTQEPEVTSEPETFSPEVTAVP